MNPKNLVRLLGLVLAAVLVATSLQVLPRLAPPAAAEDVASPTPPAPEPDVPLGQPLSEPGTGFVEGVSVEDRPATPTTRSDS